MNSSRPGSGIPSTSLFTDVEIAVSDSHFKKIDRVVRRLEAAGMIVEQVRAETGVVVGKIDPARFENLTHVPGVGSAERYGLVRIGPHAQRRE